MTRILLLSDTHGYMNETILQRASEADQVWHAGDIGNLSVTDALKGAAPVTAVYGNIDGADIRGEFPLNQNFTCDGIRVLMTHIGGYPGRYLPTLRQQIRDLSPEVVICGHSHILKVQRDQKHQHIHLNPGAIGIHGFHQVRTMLRFSIDKGKLLDMEVLEYKR